MRIFVAAKALTSILTTRSMAASAPCELRLSSHVSSLSLRRCYMALLAARLPIPGEHARRMLAASLWDLYPGCPRVPLLLATSRCF